MAVAIAVLSFGGTAPQFLAITEVIILLLGVLQFSTGRDLSKTYGHIPVAVPVFLIGLVLLQIVPVPVSWARVFESGALIPPITLRSPSAPLLIKPSRNFLLW